jgi:protein gp37
VGRAAVRLLVAYRLGRRGRATGAGTGRQIPGAKKGVDEMKATKIDWCDCTVNPFVGCPRGCPYCYARRLNARFRWIEDFSKPQFFPERLKAFGSKKPKSIFVNSMSDIEFWAHEQAIAVMEKIAVCPQHNYIFLTKGNCKLPLKEKNWFLGLTVDKQSSLKEKYYDSNRTYLKGNNYDFLSVEPILEPIEIPFWHFDKVKLVIIGAETGNRKGKIVPEFSWVGAIMGQCDAAGIAVFMKESLRELMGDYFRQDKLPWELTE